MALTEPNSSSVTCETNCDSRESERETGRRGEAGDGIDVITTKTDERRVRGAGREKRLARQRNLEEWSDKRNRDQARGMWEQEAEKKNLRLRIRREVEKAEAAMDEDLERRRSRLFELLRSEEEEYLKESVLEEEDPASKSARMLSRYLELRTKKEEERQRLADEKREQQFKRNCNELRSTLGRRLQRDTAEEGRKILAERRRRREKDEESMMYSEMWRRDEEQKRRREEEEEKERRKKGMEWGAGLEMQIKETRERRRRELMEKEEEAEMRTEQIRLLRLEAESTVEAKRRKQEATRRDLDECLRSKLRVRAKEVQDDLMEDIFFLTHIMGEDRTKKVEKKKSLMREQQEFLQYLRDCAKKEAEFERDLEKMCDEELDKAWSKRRQEAEEEKKRRGKVEKEAVEGVQRQIMDNLEKWRNAQCVNKEYAEKVMSEDQEDRKRADERLRLIRERNIRHQNELEDQIRERREKQDRDRRLQEAELEAIRKAREREEAKIRHMVAEMEIDCPHPYRVGRKEAFDDCGDH